MYRNCIRFVAVFALIVLPGTYAVATVITPTAIADVSNDDWAGPYGVGSIHTKDGSGLTASATSPTGFTQGNVGTDNMWLCPVQVSTYVDSVVTPQTPAYITFDLGAAYSLSNTLVWNYNNAADLYGGMVDSWRRGGRDYGLQYSEWSEHGPHLVGQFQFRRGERYDCRYRCDIQSQQCHRDRIR